MQKSFPLIPIVSMASAVAFMVREPSIFPVLVFIASALLLAFMLWLERSRIDELTDLRITTSSEIMALTRQVKELQDKVGGVMVALSANGI